MWCTFYNLYDNIVPGNAYLAQSPQLYKQMAIAADYEKVFTVGAGKMEDLPTAWLISYLRLFMVCIHSKTIGIECLCCGKIRVPTY